MDQDNAIAAAAQAVNPGAGHARRSAEQWRELIAEQTGSGVGVEAFCRNHRITSSCFYRWRRFLAGGDGQGVSPWAGDKARRGGPGSRPGAGPVRGFVPVHVRVDPADVSANAGSIRLVLGAPRELILPASMPVDRLAGLIIALEKMDFDKLSRAGASS
jgi:hypothetical protein